MRMRLICALFALLGLSFGTLSIMNPAPATASVPTTTSTQCTNTTDSNGITVNNCTTTGAAQFNVDESFSNAGSLQLLTKGHAYLTIQTHHMTKSQITGKCTILPIGTFFWNGFEDSQTGQVKYKPWHVTSGPGENKFCPGKDHKLHKFNCNNPVKGVPFHTAAPPKKQRIRGHAFVGNYLTWAANLQLTASKHVGGTITVHNPDNTCTMTLYLDNNVRASNVLAVTVRARNIAQARSAAVGSVKAQASSSQKVKSSLQQSISLYINSQIKGVCTSTGTPPPPPPPSPEHPQGSINAKNDVDVNNTATVCGNYDVPSSHHATLTFGSTYGSYPGGKTFTVTGSGTQCTTYQAPGEVPPGGKDTLSVSLRDNTTGLSDNTPDDNSTSIVINAGGTPN